jgi:hypothetical protein
MSVKVQVTRTDARIPRDLEPSPERHPTNSPRSNPERARASRVREGRFLGESFGPIGPFPLPIKPDSSPNPVPACTERAGTAWRCRTYRQTRRPRTNGNDRFPWISLKPAGSGEPARSSASRLSSGTGPLRGFTATPGAAPAMARSAGFAPRPPENRGVGLAEFTRGLASPARKPWMDRLQPHDFRADPSPRSAAQDNSSIR